MKKETHLQPSSELAPFFAERREEASLLATTDVEKLISDRAMLPPANHHTIRRLIMTITGLAGIAALVYFTGFHQPTTQPSKTKVDSKREALSLKPKEPA
jgi:hypothetical protein